MQILVELIYNFYNSCSYNITFCGILFFVGMLAFINIVATLKVLIFKTTNFKSLLILSFCGIIVNSLFCFGEYFFNGVIFNTLQELLTFILFNVYIFTTIFSFNYGLSMVISKFRKPKKINSPNCIVLSSGQANFAENLESEQETFIDYNGYVNINEIKDKIQKLKNKDSKFIIDSYLEEFEVYLLNFSYRQPNYTERLKLKEYLNYLEVNL